MVLYGCLSVSMSASSGAGEGAEPEAIKVYSALGCGPLSGLCILTHLPWCNIGICLFLYYIYIPSFFLKAVQVACMVLIASRV